MKAFADLLAHCPNLKVCKLDNSHKDQYAHEGEDEVGPVPLDVVDGDDESVCDGGCE